MSGLPAKIVALHKALDRASLPHAFGGALALAWCTQRARGTIDIDVNIFVSPEHSETVFKCLPAGVAHSAKDLDAIRREGQVRLWWEQTPIDLFLNTTRFHDEAAQRTRWETFSNRLIPFLSCEDIAVFKAFFNRTKDWADLEEMHAAGTLDISAVVAVLVEYLGATDERIERLKALAVG
jgi:hypothetical protein